MPGSDGIPMVTIDHRFYPHIISWIFSSCDYKTLLKLRTTCRDFREAADCILAHHVILDAEDMTCEAQLHARIVTATGYVRNRRIPALQTWHVATAMFAQPYQVRIGNEWVHPTKTTHTWWRQNESPLPTPRPNQRRRVLSPAEELDLRATLAKVQVLGIHGFDDFPGFEDWSIRPRLVDLGLFTDLRTLRHYPRDENTYNYTHQDHANPWPRLTTAVSIIHVPYLDNYNMSQQLDFAVADGGNYASEVPLPASTYVTLVVFTPTSDLWAADFGEPKQIPQTLVMIFQRSLRDWRDCCCCLHGIARWGPRVVVPPLGILDDFLVKVLKRGEPVDIKIVNLESVPVCALGMSHEAAQPGTGRPEDCLLSLAALETAMSVRIRHRIAAQAWSEGVKDAAFSNAANLQFLSLVDYEAIVGPEEMQLHTEPRLSSLGSAQWWPETLMA